MRTHKKTLVSSRRRLVLVVFFSVLALLLVGGITLYALRMGPFKQQASPQTFGTPTNSVDYNPPTPEQTAAGEAAKQQSANGSTGSDPSPAPTPPASGSSKSGVGMEITAANVNAGVLQIRTLIQTVTSSGTCTLTASGPNGTSYTASSGVQAGPSTSTCKGFDIPISSLSSGKWSIRIDFENASLQASATTEMTI